jgi:hypothetical protein
MRLNLNLYQFLNRNISKQLIDQFEISGKQIYLNSVSCITI